MGATYCGRCSIPKTPPTPPAPPPAPPAGDPAQHGAGIFGAAVEAVSQNYRCFPYFLTQVSNRTRLNFRQLFDQATPYLGFPTLRSALAGGLRIEPFVQVGTETVRLIPSGHFSSNVNGFPNREAIGAGDRAEK